MSSSPISLVVPMMTMTFEGVAYTAHLKPVLVEGRPFHDLSPQTVVYFWYDLEREGLQPSERHELSLIRQRTFKMSVAGIQCVSKSYSLARTCSIRAGVCSAMISSATCSIRASQSVGGMGVESLTTSLFVHGEPGASGRSISPYFCACIASNINSAFRKLRPLSLAIL